MIPRNRFRQAGNRVQGSLKGLQTWALEAADNVSKEVLNERFSLTKNLIEKKTIYHTGNIVKYFTVL